MTRALALLAALAAGLAGGCGGGETLPVLGTVPEFRLVDRDGGAFGSAELTGRPWVPVIPGRLPSCARRRRLGQSERR